MHLGTFIAMSLSGILHVSLGCTKMWSPEIRMVLHWRPPDVSIFHTDPSIMRNRFTLSLYILLPSVMEALNS